MANNKPKTVLIVEDSRTQALSLQLFLKDSGLRVLTADNGRTGVDMACTHKPDVVLLDLEMPEMNGFEASSLISGDYRTEHIPIIILTSVEGEREAKKCRILGAVKFIHKDGFAHQKLLDQLRALRILDDGSLGARCNGGY